ncbi:hypothetical protein BT96DRAFT_1025204 [Gymnopus androsaceus JB14]|uniref:F-box domain-containing protein n=1 Tax=Gymnopus androsaceus JB14 TaxID=1447944 RepID=A0A6A4GTC0_9AGAR|nr:hypothetical protein BT96DRAFT_1025204 [Gymnopus androsaceus JB14]
MRKIYQRLERTKRLREETIQAMHNARALASPIRKVPPEILCEIFTNYICDSTLKDPESELTNLNETRATCPAICLTWVCSFWRNLALACPSFWSSIFVSIPSLLENPQQIHLLHHFITQSANAPLDIIVVHDRINNPCHDASLIQSVYNILLENYPRWRRFTSLFEHRPDGGYIQHWEAHVEQWLEEHAGSEVGHLPYLEFLHWDSGEVFFALFKWPEHRHLFLHLTELAMRYIKGYSIVDVLRQTPLLDKFSVIGISQDPTYSPAHLSPYCSNISTLCIDLDVIRSPECWKCLHLPFLKTLELGNLSFDPSDFGGDTDVDWEYMQKVEGIVKFAEILANIGPVLEKVKLDRMPGKEAIAFLALHPSVLDLTLSVIYNGYHNIYKGYDDIIDGIDISRDRDNPVILPNMRSLSISLIDFEVYHGYNSAINDLTRVVESRITASICSVKGVVPLETFALDVKLRESYIGQGICERLAGRIAVAEKDYNDFILEF